MSAMLDKAASGLIYLPKLTFTALSCPVVIPKPCALLRLPLAAAAMPPNPNPPPIAPKATHFVIDNAPEAQFFAISPVSLAALRKP